jgi:dihydrofolate reductase
MHPKKKSITSSKLTRNTGKGWTDVLALQRLNHKVRIFRYARYNQKNLQGPSMRKHTLCLIAAINPQRVIGMEQKIPWHLPADLKHFKKHTLNHTIIMGRATYESLGKALPRRRNLVLSRTITQLPDAEVYASLEAALASCDTEQEIMIIGGAHLYKQAMPLAQRILLTQVDCSCEGDAYFPAMPSQNWVLESSEAHPADPTNPYAYTFQTWSRLEKNTPSSKR